MREFRSGGVQGLLGESALRDVLKRSDVLPPPTGVLAFAGGGVQIFHGTVRHQDAILEVVRSAHRSDGIRVCRQQMTIFRMNQP